MKVNGCEKAELAHQVLRDSSANTMKTAVTTPPTTGRTMRFQGFSTALSFMCDLSFMLEVSQTRQAPSPGRFNTSVRMS